MEKRFRNKIIIIIIIIIIILTQSLKLFDPYKIRIWMIWIFVMNNVHPAIHSSCVLSYLIYPVVWLTVGAPL